MEFNKPEERKEVFELNSNPKQRMFFEEVWKAVHGDSKYKWFFFGGAIRGGKTSVCLTILHLLCRKHQNLRCLIIRKSVPNLKSTKDSFLRLYGNSPHIKAMKDGGKVIEYHSGSTITLMSENYESDKDMNKFKGLEVNVIMLEQLEELQEQTFEKCKERVGSWLNTVKDGVAVPSIPGIILATFNPDLGWLKEKIYDKYREGTLPEDFYYLQALPHLNKYVTENQWDNWSKMDELQYKRFIEGDWDVLTKVNAFFYTFSREKHLSAEVTYNPKRDIWLSFDFNVSPMTCLLIQDNGTQRNGQINEVNVIKEYRMLDTGVQEFVTMIKQDLIQIGAIRESGNAQHYLTKVYVTGDPAGASRNGTAKNANYYLQIKEILNLPANHFKLLTIAPDHENSWVFCNAIMEKFPSIRINNTNCPYLVQDLLNVEFADLKHINKMHKNSKDQTYLGHLLDCFRYYLHTRLPNFLENISKN